MGAQAWLHCGTSAPFARRPRNGAAGETRVNLAPAARVALLDGFTLRLDGDVRPVPPTTCPGACSGWWPA